MQFCSCLTWLTFVWRLRWIFDLEDHGFRWVLTTTLILNMNPFATIDFNLDDQWLVSYLPMSGTTCEGTEFEVTSSNWLHKCTSVWGSKFAYIFCLDTKSDYNQLEGGSWQQVPTSRKKEWVLMKTLISDKTGCSRGKLWYAETSKKPKQAYSTTSQDPQIRDTWFWGSKGISHDL